MTVEQLAFIHSAFEWLAIFIGVRLYMRAGGTSLVALGKTRQFAVIFGCVVGAAIGNKLVHWLYRVDQGVGLNELDQIFANVSPSDRYPRVAYSNAFKAKAGGDALNDFPTFESSHYYVMGAANLRWPSTLDYFFTDVGKAISESIYYEGNMFPPVSRSYLDLLGFDYLVALDAEIADLKNGSDVVGKVGPATILHNKQALPRAALFRRAKVIAPLRYNDLNFNSKARIDQGRSELNAIDTKSELLIEAGPSFEFHSQAGAAAAGPPQAVDIVRIANNFAVFKVHNPGADALLFYSDAYHPDWRAYVDQARRKLVRADLGFKAVVVPPGDHLVWMEFVPARAELARGLVLLLAACLFMQVARTAENRRGLLAIHHAEA